MKMSGPGNTSPSCYRARESTSVHNVTQVSPVGRSLGTEVNKVHFRSLVTRLAVTCIALGAAATCYAQSISGDAHVVDGDTLVVGSTKVRLFGIDAPEHDQTCQKAGSAWRCGEAARDLLAELIAGRRSEAGDRA